MINCYRLEDIFKRWFEFKILYPVLSSTRRRPRNGRSEDIRSAVMFAINDSWTCL